jgi:hypothetical protein
MWSATAYEHCLDGESSCSLPSTSENSAFEVGDGAQAAHDVLARRVAAKSTGQAAESSPLSTLLPSLPSATAGAADI